MWSMKSCFVKQLNINWKNVDHLCGDIFPLSNGCLRAIMVVKEIRLPQTAKLSLWTIGWKDALWSPNYIENKERNLTSWIYVLSYSLSRFSNDQCLFKVSLPARLTVDQILNNYVKSKTATKSSTSKAANREGAVTEVSAGLKVMKAVWSCAGTIK